MLHKEHQLLYEIPKSCLHQYEITLDGSFKSLAHASEVTDFNLVQNQSRDHAKRVKCSSTSKHVHVHKSRQKTLRLDTYIAKVETCSL